MARACIAGVLTSLLIAPGIPLMLSQYHLKTQMDRNLKLSNSNQNALSFKDAASETEKPHGALTIVAKSVAAAFGFYPAKSPILFLLCATPLAGVLLGIGYLWLVKSDEICRFFGVVACAMTLGLLVLHLGHTRYILPLVPLLVLAIARVIQYWTAAAHWRYSGTVVAVFLVGLYFAGFYRHATRPHGRPWQNLVRTLQQHYHKGDRVVFDALYAEVPFDYFAAHQHFQPEETGFPVPIYDWWDSQRFEGWGGPVVTQQDLSRFVESSSSSKTLWLVLYETYYYDPHEALLAQLRQKGEVTEIDLPPDPDSYSSDENSNLRLIRVAIH